MLSNLKKILRLTTVTLFRFIVLASLAAASRVILIANAQNPIGGNPPVVIEPPFSGTLLQVLDRIVNFLILIGAPIATIMILYGAFQILTAGAKSDQFTKGKNTIVYAAVGYGIVLIAKGVVYIVQELIKG